MVRRVMSCFVSNLDTWLDGTFSLPTCETNGSRNAEEGILNSHVRDVLCMVMMQRNVNVLQEGVGLNTAQLS